LEGVALPIQTKRMSIGNTTPTKIEKQRFFLAPPSKTKERKLPENCFRSYIDQVADGFYHASKLVRNTPQTNKDIYFTVRTRTTEVRSNRRNYSHKSVALYRTKKEGPTRANIAYMTCSFLELDGSTDGTIKTINDVNTLINKNNLPMPSYVIETSRGHFHLIWNYNNPLPWTTKNESYWISQQKRLIELFKQAHFNVDESASLNPTQNLRNPSQLQPYNFKRRCEVQIHSSYKKTSLRAIFRALNRTNIPNPRPMRASVKLRRFSRANKTFILTHSELAENLKMSLRTINTEISRAVQNGDLRIVARLGNNGEKTRTTQYESLIFIEQFPEVQLSICKANSFKETNLLSGFQANGAKNGRRNRTVFVLAVGLSCESNQTLTVGEIADQLREGAMRSGLSEGEFLRTVKNGIKNIYSNPFNLPKMREWNLLEGPKHFH